MFLQDLLDQGWSPSTPKVFAVSISCQHSDMDGCTAGSPNHVSLFLRDPLQAIEQHQVGLGGSVSAKLLKKCHTLHLLLYTVFF